MHLNIFKTKINNYWRNIDKRILFSFVLLFFLGLFFSFSSTSSLAGERLNKDYYFFFSKHLIFVFASLLIMFSLSFIEVNILNNLILVAFIGVEVKGAKRWLNIYIFRLQPVELIKPFFVLVVAKILTINKLKNLKISYFLSFLVLISIILLLVNQPDIGQSILLIGTWISIVFISGIPLAYIFAFIFLFFSLLAGLLIVIPQKFSYITNRIQVFLDPNKGDSFQTQKALDAIKQGGIKGQGMGEGILKDGVPEAHTDYVIAIISEEFGSIVSIIIATVFLYIAFRIIKVTINVQDKNLKISLCGLASLLMFQTFIHIGVNTSLLPTTGMTLPFLSYGGSSLFGSAILAGVILNYTKNRLTDDEN
jgi:cell division protein FtsW